MSLTSFGVRKPVLVNLYVFGLIMGGLFFGSGIRREFFPEVNPTEVIVAAPYPGASPDEVERSLATKIEDRLADLRDIEEMTTVVTEGLASVRIEFEDGVDIDAKVAEVKREVDALQDLPDRVERIIVTKFEPNIPVIILNLHGDIPERVLKEEIQRIRNDLTRMPGMGTIQLSGARTDEIAVEVRPGALVEHGLSLPRVTDRVRQAMIEVPGGSVRGSGASQSVRTMGADERADAVRDIIVKAGADGAAIRVGDIATVTEGFVDADLFTRFNGRPSVGLTVFKVGDGDAIDMADMVKAYVAGRKGEPIRPTLIERLKMMGGPADGPPVSARLAAYETGRSRGAPPAEITLASDLSRFISQRLQLLARNAGTGAFFVFVTLMLLLNWRSSFWVTLGLFVAVMGTLILMRLSGITLNLLTMFGLILVVGMLVDDGIVIAENISTKHDAGEPAGEAAIHGTSQIAWPVVATIVTTVFAFLPLMLLKGRIGDLLGALPLVVVCALSVSLIEALFSLPKHMSKSLARSDERRARGGAGRFTKIEERFDAARDRFFARWVLGPYRAASRATLERPWLTLSATVGVLMVSLGMVAGGRLPFVFFDSDDTETLLVDLRMPVGTPVERTDAIIRKLEEAALEQPEVKSVFAMAGATADLEGAPAQSQGHRGQLFIELTPVEVRQANGERTGDSIKVAIRTRAGVLPGVKSLKIEGVEGGPGGPAISLAVLADDARAADPVIAALKERLGSYEGVYDVADDADAGSRELRLTPRPGASELGFTTESVALQVRGAVHGLEAHTFPGEREDVDVRVRYPEAERRSLAAIESMYLFTPDGRPVPLGEVVKVEETTGYATVRRLDRRRAVTVTAEVDDSIIRSPEEVTASLAPEIDRIRAEHPEVRIVARGRQQDLADSFSTLPIGMAVALALNYIVLAWLFQSYAQPLLVMTAIPLAIVGMIWGHIIMGYSLTFLSLIGFVALSGVVVNNSIVYMDFYNARRRAGLGALQAAYESGAARIRPILLTTITTTAGLGPLVLETSFQAKVLIPMAITICFGLMFSAVLVLLALPCLLVALDQTKRGLGAAWTGRLPGPAPTLEP